MPKNKISEFSSTPANNTDIGGIDIAEGCAPSGINNAIRELMAQLKDQQAGTDADNFTVGGNLNVTGTSTLTGAITATAGVTGNLTGNVTGNVTGNTSGTSANVTGVVAVANGGTGQSSSTGSGAVVLAISPTLVTPALGTPSALVGTNITGTANSLNAGIGVNQTWQNMTSSRAFSTDYTNNTGKPIMFSVTNTIKAAGIELYVGGVLIGQCGQTGGFGNDNNSMSAIVPNGATYRANAIRTTGTLYWAELR